MDLLTKTSATRNAGHPLPMPARAGIRALALALLVTGSWSIRAAPTDLPKPNALPASQDASSRYPQTVSFASSLPSAEETAAVRADLGRTFGREWTDFERTEGRRIRFSVGHADLNGDGRPDLLVRLDDIGFGYCGSAGCAGYAILATPQGYAPKAIELAVFNEKIALLPSAHRGMHDLRLDDARKVFTWDGARYR